MPIFQNKNFDQDAYYLDWMDPGAFALLGAVSFFAGVSRLTMSLAVIMVEITNDIQEWRPIYEVWGGGLPCAMIFELPYLTDNKHLWNLL